MHEESLPENDPLSLPVLVRRMVLGILLLFVTVGLLGYLLADPLEAASRWFIASFGRAGLFLGVLLVDSIPFTTHEPLLFLSYTGGVRFWEVFGLAGTASMLAAGIGWTCGRTVGRLPAVARLFERYHVTPFLRRYGAAAVAVAALTPFPYAIMTWGAGACGVRLEQVMIGALLRYPKVLFYLSVIVLGWTATT